MRKITGAVFLSLDGVLQAPGGPSEDYTGGFAHGGWATSYFDETLFAQIGEWFTPPYGLLLGRRTFDIFAAHWPYAGDDPIAVKFNAITKYVATSEPQTLSWQNSVALHGDVAAEVAALKRQDGRKLLLQGSSELIQALLAKDLIDEITLLTFPVVLGKGKRLFGDASSPRALTLVASSTSENGIVISKYARAGEVTTGSFEFETPTDAELERRRNLT